MLSVKTALLGAVAAVSLGGAAHAEATATPLANSGVWSAARIDYLNGIASCSLQTDFPDSGRHVLVAVVPRVDGIRVMVTYDNWSTPKDFPTNLDLVFDGTERWITADKPDAVASGKVVRSTLVLAASAAFVHAFTAGNTMELTVRGTTPLMVSLAGTTAVWGPFMDCVKSVSPTVVASITNPTAFAATSPPAAPAVTAAIPPAVPFMRDAPAVAARQPNIAEVGLLTDGGVKHVRGVAGSDTAILFMLDSGASLVQLPRAEAGQLALEGMLTPTGRHETFTDANGGKTVQPIYILKSLTVGERTVTNIECTVTSAGDPLLGQSFLGRLNSWSIDNARQMLVLGAPIA